MEHKSLDEIRPVADIVTFAGTSRPMTREERLQRWATALERHNGPVRALRRTEYLPAEERARLRGDDTPLSVAFADAILRGEGLASDRLGDVTAFFDLSEHEAHHLVCDCHYGGTMTAATVAGRIRGIANRTTMRQFWDRARGAMTGRN